MISLQRVRTDDKIHEFFRGPKKLEFEQELMEQRRSILKGDLEKQEFNSGRWKQAKERLQEDTVNKCAYCEAPTMMVAYGDVEHYRPKSKYWWLAYCYDNYLVSCQLCNQAFKKDRFPCKNSRVEGPMIESSTADDSIAQLKGSLGPNPLDPDDVASFVDLYGQEGALLLNPYFDKPEDFFAWEADDALKEVALVARPGVDGAEEYVEAAEEFYGLNRPNLKTLRYFIFFLFRHNLHTLADPGISPALKEETIEAIELMKSNGSPFAGMVRYFDETGVD